MIETIALALLAGMMIPVGGTIAATLNIQRDWLQTELRHSVMAFGGGALLSAIAFVLIPQGEAPLPALATITCLAGGAVLMSVIDARLMRRGTPAAQVIAMLADFIPEVIALGAVIAADDGTALLLTIMIALQNLPEGFNAYREQADAGGTRRRILISFVLLAMIGPAGALSGYLFLAELPQVTGALMLGAAGAILYLIFQSIAPNAKLDNEQAPPLAAVAGFLLGMMGHLLI